MTEPRYRYVDLLRGLAAVAVLICHYRWFYARFPNDWPTDVDLPAYRFLWPIYEHGGLAVPLFWCLSGFVFAVAYGRFGKGISIRDFWVRRFSRLYPLHLLTLLIVAALQGYSMAQTGAWQVYSNNDALHFVAQLFFASNWLTSEPSFNGPIWSVSIEELIYLGFLVYLTRFGPNAWVALAIAAASLALEHFTGSQIALCGALFFIGVAVSEAQRRALVVGLAGLALTAVLRHSTGAVIYLGAPSLLTLFIGLDRRFPFPRRLEWFGLSTYSIYLWHMPVLIALRLGGITPPLWMFATGVLALSYFSFRYFERPSQTWIRHALGINRPERLPSSRRSARDANPSDFAASGRR